MMQCIADMFINQSALPTDMAYVAVLKAIGPKELAMASRGIIPPDLGGGEFGARNVPRGFPDAAGTGLGGRGFTPASDKYFERMRGGADVPEHQMAREAEGRPPIPHSGRLPEGMRGGGGLAGAMRRQGVNTRQFYPGTGPTVQGGVPPGFYTGVRTAQIPGRVEAAPHEHRHAELAEEGQDDAMNNLAAAFDRRNNSLQRDLPPLPFDRSQRFGGPVRTSSMAAVRDSARTRTTPRADQPQSTGSRRTEQ